MKFLFATVSVLAVLTLAAVAPDLKRYLRLRAM